MYISVRRNLLIINIAIKRGNVRRVSPLLHTKDNTFSAVFQIGINVIYRIGAAKRRAYQALKCAIFPKKNIAPLSCQPRLGEKRRAKIRAGARHAHSKAAGSVFHPPPNAAIVAALFLRTPHAAAFRFGVGGCGRAGRGVVIERESQHAFGAKAHSLRRRAFVFCLHSKSFFRFVPCLQSTAAQAGKRTAHFITTLRPP